MTGAILPAAAAFVALGLALTFARLPVRFGGLVLAIIGAAAAYRCPVPGLQPTDIHLVSWGLIIVAAASIFLRQSVNASLLVVMALALGSSAGAITGLAGAAVPLIFASTGALIVIPAGWLARHGQTIALRVVASWLVAIACLSASIELVPTPGYEADHMD